MIGPSSILAIWMLAAPATALAQEEPTLIVHEWGTFTTKHYYNGFVLSGMNAIDHSDSVPKLVHQIEDTVLRTLDKTNKPTDTHPDVTMRPETHVIYFYPSASFDKLQALRVKVDFRGGLLNEFYPDAHVNFEGIQVKQFKGANGVAETRLTDNTSSQLQWSDLQLGGPYPGPKTDERIWTAPRNATASGVLAKNG